MRKIYFSLKLVTLVLVMMLATTFVKAQRVASVSGPWDNTLTWGGAAVPTSAETVVINDGINVTVPVDAECASITFASASGSISVDPGFTLDVTTSITLQGSNTINTAATLTGGGTILCASLQVGGTGTLPTADRSTVLTSSIANLTISGNLTIRSEDNGGNQGNSSFDLVSGSVSVGGSIVLDADSDGGSLPTSDLNMNTGAETGTLTITGATPFSTPGGGTVVTDFNGTSATVNYNGAAQNIRTATYRNLEITNAGVKTIQADIDVNGNLTINTGSTLTAPVGGSDDIALGGNWLNNGNFNAGDDVVTFDGTSQTIDGSSTTTFNNLNISSSTASTLLVNIDVVGALTVTAGDVFNMSTFTANRTAAGGTLTVAGTLRLGADAGGQTGSNFPSGFTTFTMTGGTVEYDGSNAITQTVFATPTYENITLTNGSGSGVSNKIMTGSITMNGTLTVNANTVLTPGATNNFLPGATNTITGTGTIKVTRVAATPDYFSQYDFDTDNLDALTVDYAGAGNQTINIETYGSIVTSGSGTKTLGGAVTANDNITAGAGTTLDIAGFTASLVGGTVDVFGTLDFSNATGSISSTGTSTLTMGANGVIRTFDVNGLGPAANASLIQTSGTFTTSSIATNGTVEYYRNATSAQIVTDRDYNNLTISGNTQIKNWTLAAPRTINGDIVISADAPFTLLTGQSIDLKGDWEDNSTGAFVQGTTDIIFGGSTAQEIRGTQATTFIDLVISNTSTGVTLNQDVFIDGTMTFNDGVVSSSAANLLTFNNGSSVGGTPSDDSHVDGPIKKLGLLGGTFRFPSGDAGQYEFIEIVATTDYDFTAQYIRTSATAIDADVVSPIINVSNCDHWTLVPGTSVPTATILVTLSWSDLNPCGAGQFVTDPSALTVGRYNTTAWEQAGIGITSFTGSNSSGTVSRTIVSAFGFFSLANTVVNQNPLPVKFSSIRAYEKASGIQIDWIAYQEENLAHYVIERSANGSSFTAIGSVAAVGTLSATNYGFFDAAPLPGVNYYRIKPVDMDSRVSYSNIVKVNLDKSNTSFSLYPNPVTSGHISFQSSDLRKGNYSVRVFNVTGQEVFNQRFSHTGGAINQTIQLPAGIRSGMYSIQLEGDGEKIMTRNFMVQ